MSVLAPLRNRRRLEMNLTEVGIPDLPLLGRYNYTKAHPPLRDHQHRNAIEICFLEKGRQSYYMDHRFYRLRGGDIFITPPNKEHSTGGEPEEKGVLYWIVIRLPKRSAGLFELSPSLSQVILDGLISAPTHFRGSLKLKEHLDRITTLFHEDEHPLRAFALLNRVRDSILEILECARLHTRLGSGGIMQSTCNYIQKNLAEPLSVSMLAEHRKMSLPHFKALFKRETGIPPAEYVLRAKITEAQRLLSGRASVTEVSYQLGFSSSQYFSTVFKRFTGRTPTFFRLQKLSTR